MDEPKEGKEWMRMRKWMNGLGRICLAQRRRLGVENGQGDTPSGAALAAVDTNAILYNYPFGHQYNATDWLALSANASSK